MVTVDLIGRLGNQMFQIATCAAHAWRTGQKFIIPKHSLDTRIWPTYFPHLVNNYKWNPIDGVWEEPSHAYTPIPTNLFDVKLHGYFQSEKYFKEYKEDLRNLFGFVGPHMGKHESCSIHIRIGDYAIMQDKHPIISDDYLDNAVKFIVEHTGIINFMVFSDSPELAKQKIDRHLYVGCKFAFVGAGQPLQDMRLMHTCIHHICANSSYSWWAAWLCMHLGKVVIMPRAWFGPGNAHLETKDIYPEGAIVL